MDTIHASSTVFDLSFRILEKEIIKKEQESTLHIIQSKKKGQSKDIKAINKVKDVVCFLLSCRKYFCKYVESIKYLLNNCFLSTTATKTIMYRGTCVDEHVAVQFMYICN